MPATPVRVMDEGESPVGLAHYLARSTRGNSKKLVSARQTHFDGLGFFGLGWWQGVEKACLWVAPKLG